MSAIRIGLGVTLNTDLWALFLQLAFKIAPPNYCLGGRWLRPMPEGIFKHSNIASAPQKSADYTGGWIAHYIIGVLFATAFVAFVGHSWLQQPMLIPALISGVVTVLMPFFIMQPSFGLGLAAAKTSNPRSMLSYTHLSNATHPTFSLLFP